jgi:hypothetical protein
MWATIFTRSAGRQLVWLELWLRPVPIIPERQLCPSWTRQYGSTEGGEFSNMVAPSWTQTASFSPHEATQTSGLGGNRFEQSANPFDISGEMARDAPSSVLVVADDVQFSLGYPVRHDGNHLPRQFPTGAVLPRRGMAGLLGFEFSITAHPRSRLILHEKIL